MGPWTFDGGLPKGMCAHPKVDPETGDLVVFRYDFAEPYLTWAVVGRTAPWCAPETPIPIDGTYMIHDCAITADHLVLFVCPFRFDIAAAMRGEPVLSLAAGSRHPHRRRAPRRRADHVVPHRSVLGLALRQRLRGRRRSPLDRRRLLPVGAARARRQPPSPRPAPWSGPRWTSARAPSTSARSTMASPSSHASMIGCSAAVIATSTPPAATATTRRRSPACGTRSSASTSTAREQGRPPRRSGVLRRSRLRAAGRQHRRGRRLRDDLRLRHDDAGHDVRDPGRRRHRGGNRSPRSSRRSASRSASTARSSPAERCVSSHRLAHSFRAA